MIAGTVEASGRPAARLPLALVVVGGVAAFLTLRQFAAAVPPVDWPRALVAPGEDLRQLVFSAAMVPRVVVSWLVGAGLALAGLLLQQVLRNPLADTSTLGVAAGAHLALAVASLYAPAAMAFSQEAICLVGSFATVALLLCLVPRSDGAPLSLILAGLTVNLLFGAASAALTVLNHDNLSGLFLWQSGSLVQNGWQTARYLAPKLALCAGLALLLRRPLVMASLDDGQLRSLGLGAGALRLAAVGIAVTIGALCVSAVGVIGFIGIVAPHAARILGARTFSQRLAWAPPLGALLLWLADACVQSTGLRAEIPAGSAMALVGAPFFVVVLLRQRSLSPPRLSAPGRAGATVRPPPFAVAAAAAGAAVLALAAVFFGRSPDGWQWASFPPDDMLLAFRLPRVATAAAAGAMLAVAGLLLQRSTRNAMASPEVLGVSAGAALGIVLTMLIVATPGPRDMFVAGTAGALAALLLIMLLNGRGESPDRLLLIGVSLATAFTAIGSVVLTSGDPRAALLLTWMSGSTYRATTESSTFALATAAATIPFAFLLSRWLLIAPLGPAVSRSVGLNVAVATCGLLTLASLMTAAATLTIGPLTFVGLIAPHMVRALGIRRPLGQTAAAVLVGSTLLVAADWLGRTIIFPWQIPTGLMSTLLGAPLFLVLLHRARS